MWTLKTRGQHLKFKIFLTTFYIFRLLLWIKMGLWDLQNICFHLHSAQRAKFFLLFIFFRRWGCSLASFWAPSWTKRLSLTDWGAQKEKRTKQTPSTSARGHEPRVDQKKSLEDTQRHSSWTSEIHDWHLLKSFLEDSTTRSQTKDSAADWQACKRLYLMMCTSSMKASSTL